MTCFFINSFCADFDLGNSPLSEKQALNNIQAVCDYCTAHLSPSAFHIPPIDFLQWAESGLLKSNILALLARLFYSLELGRAMSTLKSCGTSSSSSLPPRIYQFKGYEKKQRYPPQILDHSESTETAIVLPKLNGSEPGSSRTTIISRKKLAKLSSPSAEPHMDSTIFDAPLRSSLDMQQVSALPAFRRDKISQTKDTHSQSSPLLNMNMPLIPSIKRHSSQNKPILSIDSVMLKEQMNDIQMMGSFVRRPMCLLEHSAGMRDNTTNSPCISRIYECTTKQGLEECDSSESGSLSLQCKDATLTMSESTIVEELTGSQCFMRESFTVDKQHTYATANAAGLPIVDTRVKSDRVSYYLEDKSAPRYEKVIANTSSSDKGIKMGQNTPPELLFDSGSDVIILTNLLDLHHYHDSAGWKYNTPAKRDATPPNVRKLKENLIPVIAGLQSQIFHLESEVMLQMLKLHSKKNTNGEETSVGGNIPASAAFSLSKTAFGDGGSTTTALDKDDPLAIVTGAGFQKVTASLELFEKDEELILQQDTPCACTEASAIETVAPVNAGISYKPLALSPLANTNSINTHVKDRAPVAQASSIQRDLPSQESNLKPSTLHSLGLSSGKGSGASVDDGDGGGDGSVHLEGATANTNPTNPWVPPLCSVSMM